MVGTYSVAIGDGGWWEQWAVLALIHSVGGSGALPSPQQFSCEGGRDGGQGGERMEEWRVDVRDKEGKVGRYVGHICAPASSHGPAHLCTSM